MESASGGAGRGSERGGSSPGTHPGMFSSIHTAPSEASSSGSARRDLRGIFPDGFSLGRIIGISGAWNTQDYRDANPEGPGTRLGMCSLNPSSIPRTPLPPFPSKSLPRSQSSFPPFPAVLPKLCSGAPNSRREWLCVFFSPPSRELSGSAQAPAWEWECPVGAGNSAGQIPKITKTPNFPRFPAQGFAQSQILCRNSFPPKPHTYKETQNSRFSLGFLTSLCRAPRGFPALLEPRSLSGVFLSLPDPNSRG